MNQASRNLLVIDDETHLLIGLKALLEQKGDQVTTCTDGITGIRLAKELHPDVIICDIMMPSMNGFDVKSRLSNDPNTRDIPFLFLSARTNQTDKLRGLGSGADDYLTKPFDPRELIARIEAVLRRHEKGRSAAEQEMTAEIDRIHAEISRNLSHELRTPMTQILMSLDMILREKYRNPSDLHWFAETALSQSYRLNSLIDDLVFLSGYDAGHFAFLRQKIHLSVDFKDPIASRSELYKDKNINLIFNISQPIAIHAPRREFRQAAVHLVDNGMKFSPPDSSVLIELDANGQGGCVFTVTDFGEGIPADLQEKAFDRFYQISQGDTRKFGGLGVGLTIARTIARSLGGDVVFLPKEKGCQVRMTLPPAPLDLP